MKKISFIDYYYRIKKQINISYTNRLFLLFVLFFAFSTQSMYANGGIGYKGISINIKGTKTWYKAHNVAWGYSGCTDYSFNSAADFSGQDFGSFTSSETLQISGFAVVGWTDGTDWVAGKLLYKVWKQGDSEPGTWNEISVGNYGNANGATQVVCSSGSDRIVGYNNGITNINPGAPGAYNLKIQALGRMQWSGGFFNTNDGTEVTATFTVSSSSATDNFRSKVTGNWSTAGSWESSSNNTNWGTSTLVPGSSAASITLLDGHNITLNQAVTIPSLTINSGATFTASDASARTLTISKSTSGTATTIANSGTWVNGSGGSTVVFTGAPSGGNAVHATSGTIGFQNITINKTGGSSNVGASFGIGSSVSGTLEIGSGGYVSIAPPASFYGSLAILKFNQGSEAIYNVETTDNSWSTTVVPNYITISSGTVNLNAARTATGNLLIDGGTLALANALTIQGNWTRSSGTFTPNTQTVTLSGTTNTVISTASDASLYDLVVSKTGGAYVSLSSNLSVTHNMTISSGAVFNIPSGKSLTVSGTLTNNAGNTGLVIASDATGTGSLIHSTTSVAATVQRYVPAATWNEWNDGWHALSSPVSAQAVAGFTEVTPADYDIYSWYEQGNVWVNYKNTTEAPTWSTANTISNGLSNDADNFLVGKGYLVSYKNNVTKSFTGTLNNANVSITGMNITSAESKSFHLLGNPFASALLWDASWTKSNIAATIQVWSEALQDYSSVDYGSYIPAMNGFMVELTADAASITIPVAKRAHNATSWYKNQTASTQRLKLTVMAADGGSGKEAIIRFDPMSTNSFDAEFDGSYLQGYGPVFYSNAGEQQLSVNTLPSLTNTTEIPLTFVRNYASDFEFRAEGIETIPADIYLNDLKTGTSQNLRLNPVYAFSSSDSDSPNRFKITFSAVGIDEPENQNSLQAYVYGNRVYVTNTLGKANMELFDLQGRLVQSNVMNGTGLQSQSVNLPAGVYVVRVNDEKSVKSVKLVIE